MRICSICHRISGTNEDHIHCIEMRRIKLEDDNLKENLPEKLDVAKDSGDIGKEVNAILGHITKDKEKK